MRWLLIFFLLTGLDASGQASWLTEYSGKGNEKKLLQTTFFISPGKPGLETFYENEKIAERVFYCYKDTNLITSSQYIFRDNNDSIPGWTSYYSNGDNFRVDFFYPNGTLKSQKLCEFDTAHRLISSEYYSVDLNNIRHLVGSYSYNYPSKGIIVCKKTFNDSLQKNNTASAGMPYYPPDTTFYYYDKKGRIVRVKEVYTQNVFTWGSYYLQLQNTQKKISYNRRHPQLEKKSILRRNGKLAYKSHSVYYKNGKLKKSCFCSAETDSGYCVFYDRDGNKTRRKIKSGRKKEAHYFTVSFQK